MNIKGIKLSTLFLWFILLFNPFAFSFGGDFQTKGLFYPDREELFEIRSSLLLENKVDFKSWLIFYQSCSIEGIFSNKKEDNNEVFPKVRDTDLNFYFPAIDVKIGYSKVFWGKLDYISPVDMLNPLDVTKLFLEGERKEAKLSVPLLMVSPYWGREYRLDFVLVPFFKKGTYDELKEKNSPFDPVFFPLPVEEDLPLENIKNMEYGSRFSGIFGEIDWSLYYFRGFGDFPSYCLDIDLNKINAVYFQNDMFGYDFELVWGKWGIRGEGALFAGVGFQDKNSLNYHKGDSFTGGLGLDRTFGDNYVNFNLLYKKILIDEVIEERKDEVTMVANIERKFSYEKKILKLFSMYNLIDDSCFLKGTFSINCRENLWTDLSAGFFTGEGEDNLSKFKNNDFFSIKFKYSF
ncbi:hypothetical protein KAU39_00450 [bacterium]|nr:hypothetical protein [bacterium]